MSRELVSGFFWLAVAIFAAWQGLTLKLGTLSRPGPGFFPFWGAVVLGVLSLILVVNALRRPGGRPVAGLGSLKAGIVLGLVLGYLLLLERLGFVIVTFLLLLLLLRVERRGWAFSTATALLGAAVSYVVFQSWLRTQLPAGPLGF